MVQVSKMPRLTAIPPVLASLLAAGCATDSPRSALSQDRIQALVRIGESGKRADVPQVLPSLASDDPLVRWTAQRTLQNLTGTTNGYDWSADHASRERAIKAWSDWCAQQGLMGTPAKGDHA